jgi:hypothetical protein
MDETGIWPGGPRYLWTDGFGVVLLVSLGDVLGDDAYYDRAEAVVADVDRVLGRDPGYRIGEAPDRDGQYFHYLTVWAFALGVLGGRRPGYRERAVELVRAVHPRFVVPGQGVWWKLLEDCSGPYPGFGLGALDPFQGLAVYRFLDGGTGDLADETAALEGLVEAAWQDLIVTQDLGLGMMLWSARRCRGDEWAGEHERRSLSVLDDLWRPEAGFFSRGPQEPDLRFAFTNYGVALGLRAVDRHLDRVDQVLSYFDGYRSGDHYDTEAITHVMGCVARLPGAFLS